MSSNVIPINLGGVNCYLARCPESFVLIDTGFSARRSRLLEALSQAGCRPGNLAFIVITHGDSDHAGSAAFLQKEYHAPVGMHPDDFGMVERGDMSWNRKPRADRMTPVMRIISSLANRFAAQGSFETFTPDVAVDDGFRLSRYGFDATVVHLPGHSKGSIGVLTDRGDLYCGDFLYTTPGLGFVDNAEDRARSLEKLRGLDIKTVFPGHGRPTHVLR